MSFDETLTEELKYLNLGTNDEFQPLIICDAWYGFPIQVRPRKERILAVSKQIYNFLQWKKDYLKEKKHAGNIAISKVCVIGKAEDIDAIQKRVEELASKHQNDNTNNVHESLEGCEYMPDMPLEDLLRKHETIMSYSKVPHACYLSPDATQSLSATETPPQVVIVGMLVDRKVQPNRSKSRAESLLEPSKGTEEYVLDCAKLPLDVLNVSDLKSDEALNIDTVMEMMQRWWMNCSKDGASKKAFIDASARSMLTHRNRHPVRTIHGGASDIVK